MDFYKVLNISRSASLAEIKLAYYNQALKFHPDVTGNDSTKAQRFNMIASAYSTLSNETTRKIYDQTIGNQRVVFPGNST